MACRCSRPVIMEWPIFNCVLFFLCFKPEGELLVTTGLYSLAQWDVYYKTLAVSTTETCASSLCRTLSFGHRFSCCVVFGNMQKFWHTVLSICYEDVDLCWHHVVIQCVTGIWLFTVDSFARIQHLWAVCQTLLFEWRSQLDSVTEWHILGVCVSRSGWNVPFACTKRTCTHKI